MVAPVEFAEVDLPHTNGVFQPPTASSAGSGSASPEGEAPVRGTEKPARTLGAPADAALRELRHDQVMDLLLATIPLLAAASIWLMREVVRAERAAAAERSYSWIRRPSASMSTYVAIRRARVSGRRASWTR
jgi:hypothetical protein